MPTGSSASGAGSSEESGADSSTTETGASAGDGDGDTAGDGDGDRDSAGDGDGDPAGDGDGDPGDLPPPPSTGIQIVDVTVDQGVRVPIVQNGNWIDPNQRSTEILQNRAALIRAFYLLEEGFEQRSIYAILTVELGGESYEFDLLQTAFPAEECEGEVQMDCRYSSTVGSFNFRVPAELVQPGVEFKIETFEASPGNEDKPTAAIPHYPWEGGTQAIGVSESYRKMRVVIVPIYHDVGGDCAPAPDLSVPYGMDYEGNELTAIEYMAGHLMAQNPVDEVEIIMHEPANWGGSLTNGSLLAALSQLRQQDNAPPEQYYYALAVPCQGYPEFSGIAFLGGPSKNEAGDRVAWGVWGENYAAIAETFVHEVGHQQGRQHVFCNGMEAGVDPSYPHEGGDTNNFGTHIFRNPVDTHTPSDHDYMTYCSSTWVSEWGWNLVAPWIETISAWELEGPAPDPAPMRELLHGYVSESGEVSWWTGQGHWDPAKADSREQIELEIAGEVVELIGARHVSEDHGAGYKIVAPLPAKHEQGVLVWRDEQGVRRAIDRARINAHSL